VTGKARRVLVTGARGMLGTDLCPVLARGGWKVVPADVAEFDITDGAAARAFVLDCLPSVIVHCAAYTAVDKAESDRKTAFRINREGARQVAEAAAAVKAAMLYVSTDYVFDGTKEGPYTEEDAPNPMTVYGASKLAGEEAVREALTEHWVVRTAWLYGLHGKSFPDTILRRKAEGKALRVINDQHGCPTYTVHLAEALARIIAQPAYGTYHAVNSGACTWYDFACAAVRAAGMDADDIEPIPTSEYPLPARRPANSVLDTSKLARVYGIRLPAWRDGVVEFAREWQAIRESRIENRE
jgi:dTDP-4-dehydrorhamnose reductase